MFPIRQGESETATQSAQKQSFGKQLTHDALAGCAESDASGEFALSAGRAREEQVSDVGACDQEDESDGAEEE